MLEAEIGADISKKRILLAGYTHLSLGKPPFFESWLRGGMFPINLNIDHGSKYKLVKADFNKGSDVRSRLQNEAYDLLIPNRNILEVCEDEIISKLISYPDGGFELVKSLRESGGRWRTNPDIPVIMIVDELNREEAIRRYGEELIGSIKFLPSRPRPAKDYFLKIVENCL